jgi:hypothetical protein
VEIIPFKSVGNLNFNDNRHEIRRKLDIQFVAGAHEFNGRKELFDYFEDIDFKVIYDEHSNVDAFEFYIYAQSPIFNGTGLLTERFDDLVRMFSQFDPELESDVGEFTSYKYGIGAHIDFSKEREIARADSIIIFRKGYYDIFKKIEAQV